MKRRAQKIGFIVLLVLLLLLYFSVYTIKEGQRGLLLRLGKLATDSHGNVLVLKPGLHLCMPFVSKMLKYDMRLHTADVQSLHVLTREHKTILVDFYVKWRINDLPLYYRYMDVESNSANDLLQDKISDALRASFGEADLAMGARDGFMTILKQRGDLATFAKYGINVVDVRIKRVDLPQEIGAAVYDRMRAEFAQLAAKHRADGNAQADAIRAEADATVALKLAQARANAARIRGEGDAQAAKIYVDAYSKNKDFYAFYLSLQAYKKSFSNKKDILLLQPNTEFFKYFKGVK